MWCSACEKLKDARRPISEDTMVSMRKVVHHVRLLCSAIKGVSFVDGMCSIRLFEIRADMPAYMYAVFRRFKE
jgi:hypothetical protein